MPEFTPLWWHWCVGGLALLGLEIFIPGSFVMWFGIGALITAAISWFVPTLAWEPQALIFVALSVVSLFVGRRFIRKAAPETESTLNRRLAQYVGRVAKVAEPISEGKGKIQLGDTLWLVRGPDTPKGAEVRVTRVEGSDLIVEPVER